MSRIGKKPITIPSGVEIVLNGRDINVTGPKGKLDFRHHQNVAVEKQESLLIVKRLSNDKLSRALHGLTRNLINNMVIGTTVGYQKQLELKGVGYRASIEGQKLILNVGYTHPVTIEPKEGIEFKVEKNTLVTVFGIDKQKVGQVSAEIRKVRPPEPYKGKGIKYIDEIVRRKAGKSTKAGK
jgi:large subunit ribosomal protein L6